MKSLCHLRRSNLGAGRGSVFYSLSSKFGGSLTPLELKKAISILPFWPLASNLRENPESASVGVGEDEGLQGQPGVAIARLLCCHLPFGHEPMRAGAGHVSTQHPQYWLLCPACHWCLMSNEWGNTPLLSGLGVCHIENANSQLD